MKRAVVASMLLVACGGAHERASDPTIMRTQESDVPYELPTRPVCLAPRAREPTGDAALDALTFLDGCWSFYDVDWGMQMCWQRTADAWEADVAVLGPMAVVHTERARIADAGGTLALTCVVGTCWYGAGGDLVESDTGRVVFGSGERRIEFRVEDACRMSVAVAGYTQDYERPRP